MGTVFDARIFSTPIAMMTGYPVENPTRKTKRNRKIDMSKTKQVHNNHFIEKTTFNASNSCSPPQSLVSVRFESKLKRPIQQELELKPPSAQPEDHKS